MKKVFFMLTLFAFATSCADDTVALSNEEQLQKDIESIDAWTAAYGIKTLTDPSGLRYVITAVGTGPKPKLTNKVTVKYSGKFIKEGINPTNSKVFDQSSAAVTFNLSQLIEGWQIGFQLLGKGSKATLYIPSGLAYGKNGAGNSIPANSNLFFDVELTDVK